MRFLAEIDIMPLKEILDPQGKAIKLGLENLGIHHVSEVRMGKHMTLELEADSETEAEEKVNTACRKLLANLIMESYQYKINVLA